MKIKTTTFFLSFIFLASFSFAQTPDANGILYVKKGETGNGSAWNNAIGELADALIAAKMLNENTPETVQQIWVAKGTYHPLYSAKDINFGQQDGRYNAFLLLDKVKLYGSFEGNETTLSQRIPSSQNASILNGNTNGQNSFHVVVALGSNPESYFINGFNIINGYSLDIFSTELTTIKGFDVNVQHGAGIYANVSISVEQCKLTNNGSTLGGGIFLNAGGTENALLTRNIFENNTALRGGGLYVGMNAEIRNNLINANAAVYMGGGGMCIAGGNAKIFNNNITNNSSQNQWGGGIYLVNGNYTIYNNYFQGNTHNLSDIEGTSYPDINFLQGTVDFDYNFVQKYKAGTGNNITSGNLRDAGDPNTNTVGYKVQVGNLDFNGRKRVQGGRIDIGYIEATHYMPDANGVVYVNQNTAFDSDGSSWADAAKELATVIEAAKTNNDIKKVWVAKGTYLPMFKSAALNQNNTATTDVSKTFIWTPDLKLYGGFNGTEDASSFDLDSRDFTSNETILSGNLNGNNLNNAQHVILLSGNMGTTAEINGFTVTGGQTSGNLSGMDETVNGNLISSRHGGAIYLHNASLIAKNLIIKNNTAMNSFGGGNGAGIYFFASSTNNTLKLSKVTLSTNKAAIGGAAYHSGGIISYENVNFINNTSDARGGALYNGNTQATFVNNSFKGNRVLTAVSNFGGGAVYNGNSTGTSVKFINTLFTENESPIGGAISNNGNNTLDVWLVNCTFYKNIAVSNIGNATAAALLTVGSPKITISNSIFFGNQVTDADDVKDIMPASATITLRNNITETYGTDGVNNNKVGINPLFIDATQGNFGLQTGSSAINMGDNALYTATGRDVNTDKDLAGNPRLREANIDLGAFEAVGTLPVTLLSFQIEKENNAAVLTWETFSEKDNSGFEIFRATDNRNFISMANVTAKGTTNTKNSYTWHDRKPINGTNYYKLVQKDNGGKTEELGIRALNFTLSSEDVLLYPNPATEKANVLFATGKYKIIMLLDISGRTIQQLQINPTETEKVIVMDSIPKGTYLLKLHGETQKTTVKVIKK